MTLPPLPRGLKKLHCSYTFLTELPELPEGLEELSCTTRFLERLPRLPSSLKLMYMNPYYCNRLTHPFQPKIFESDREYRSRINRYLEQEDMRQANARCAVLKEELLAAAWHPRRVERLLELGGWEAFDAMTGCA